RPCSFTTGYGQNETLSCLIDYDLQRSGRVKALPFGCCAALTHPDPADMIQTSKQSLSVARISPLSRLILWLLFVELILVTAAQNLKRISNRMRLSRNKG